MEFGFLILNQSANMKKSFVLKSSQCQPNLDNNSNNHPQTTNEWLSTLNVGDKIDHYCENNWVIGTIIKINKTIDASFVVQCDRIDSYEQYHRIEWDDVESIYSESDSEEAAIKNIDTMFDNASSSEDADKIHVIDPSDYFPHRWLRPLYSNTFHHNYIVHKDDKYNNYEEPCQTQQTQNFDRFDIE